MKIEQPKKLNTIQVTLFKNYILSIVLTMLIGVGLIVYLGKIMQDISSGEREISLIIKIEFIIGVLSAFLLLSSILISFTRWTSRKIINPLNYIVTGLDKITQGDYSYRINFTAENEFRNLRDSFNYLALKLEESVKEREELEDLKQQLLVDISHDLKTPITSIQGYSRALYDGMVKGEDEKQKYLKIIYEKSERVSCLVDNLHEFTKLDRSGYKLKKEKEDFAEFLRNIVAEFYSEMEEKEFKLDLNIPEKEMLLQFDRKEMTRALSNIITNALKYNPRGTFLRIELYERPERNAIMLEIGDNGTGIPYNLKHKIFDPFTRGDEARQSTGGTGLGLSIAKKIIEKHGGSIELQENFTEKTVFVIELCCSD